MTIPQLAEVLGRPVSEEQAAVIRAPLGPGVVVAGAGSGKTATMVARVVWLVAAGLVEPGGVLGLTFTTRAADELAGRVRLALRRLRSRDAPRPHSAADQELEPTVSTYHAYAARLVRDHALRLGREPGARLITPATSWQLAARAVAAYDGPMDAVGWTESTVVKAVLALAGDLSEHMAGPAQVYEVGRRLRDAQARATVLRAPGRAVVAVQRAREQLMPLVEHYTTQKRERDLLDFGDAVALAAELARDHPAVREAERAAYPVVLLDEYQDTGSAQEVLLRSLFGDGHCVTAVGDPCQSIYGWRGASAGSLRRFPASFTVPTGPDALRHLTTTYRSGGRLLLLANALSEPLRRQGVPVPRLRAAPGREDEGQVRCALLPDVDAEAAWVADEVRRAVLALPAEDGAHWSRAAVLCRRRSMFPRLRAAFEALGIPVEVVGLGGLLDVPEVADVVATMRVVADPTADGALLRLLTGPRWRIGPRDLAVLGRRARSLVRPTHSREPVTTTLAGSAGAASDGAGSAGEASDGALSKGAVSKGAGSDGARSHGTGADRVGSVVDPVEAVVLGVDDAQLGSLVDALDDLPPPGREDPLSAPGRHRLTALRDELAALRKRADQPLPDLVGDIERTLGLDVEVAARPGAGPSSAARADLDAFSDAAATFAGDAAQDGEGGVVLAAFLAYLDAAEDEEHGLDAGTPGASDTVTLMTIHAAKGLEWPVVAVPGMSRGDSSAVFPARGRTSTTWTANPRLLPFPLRGDRDDLPGLAGLTPEELTAHVKANEERDAREEQRLAYVAVTRAGRLLLCSGYHWGDGKKVLGPSEFLLAARAACEAGAGELVAWAPAPEVNPVAAAGSSVAWPSPDAPAAAGVQEAGRRVLELLAASSPPQPPPRLSPEARARVQAWDDDLRRLAEEARRRRTARTGAVLPGQVSVTTLVELKRDPVALARALQRPVPRRPSPVTRRGTAFHTWLEKEVFGLPQLLDPDELPGAADDGAVADSELARLQARFRASPWWGRNPLEIEVPFEMELEGLLVRGRMDAVYRDTVDGIDRFEVVDWKTGRIPTGSAAVAAQVQLAAYRLAWHQLAGVPLDTVGAAFHYVAEGVTVRPEALLDRHGLQELLRGVPLTGQ